MLSLSIFGLQWIVMRKIVRCKVHEKAMKVD